MSRLLVAILMLVGFSTLAVAGLAENRTVQIESETLFVEHKKNRAEFKGSVYLKQGDFELRSDRLVVFYRQEMGGELERADAYGNVEMRQGERRGFSEKAVYRQKSALLIMIGDAKIEDEKGVIRGEKVTYNIDTKETTVNRNNADKRVHISIEDEGENSVQEPVP